jgi:hypothetical protein
MTDEQRPRETVKPKRADHPISFGPTGYTQRSTDNGSSMPANARSWFYLPERKTDHRFRPRPDRAFAMIML